MGLKHDKFLKPSMKMWQYFVENFVENVKKEVNLEDSFYCGNLAGRPETETRDKDFGDTDLKFA
jgi:hypothetical protein